MQTRSKRPLQPTSTPLPSSSVGKRRKRENEGSPDSKQHESSTPTKKVLGRIQEPARTTPLKPRNGPSDRLTPSAKVSGQSEPFKTPNKSLNLVKSLNATPRTPASVLSEAKAAFRRCATPSRLVGRLRERETIKDFLNAHVLAKKNGSLYISGCPGTGKTALLNEIIRDMKDSFDDLPFKIISSHLNCMSLTDAKQVYKKICLDLCKTEPPTKDAVDVLRTMFTETNKSCIYMLVLDEIDQLLSKGQDILYQFFEWASVPSSNLVLIGIANALDLTSRFLPRLKTKNCEPQLLNFDPYKISEITEIIKDRLRSLDADEEPGSSPTKQPSATAASDVLLMQPMAVELAARKMADTGDLRKALDVCRHAIEIVETEVKAASTRTENPSEQLVASNLPKVTIRHVLSATNKIFGSPNVARIKALSMQLKLVLTTLVAMIKLERKDFSVGKVLEAYVGLCKYKSQIAPVQKTEFKDLLSMLEDNGLISLSSKRAVDDYARKNVTLSVRVEDVEKGIADSPLLVAVLENSRDALRKIK